MYIGLLKIHPTHKLWYQMWDQSGWGTLRRCLNVPQNCLKVPKVCLKVPRKCLKVPPLFSGTATSSISQLQALATGRPICSILIVNLGKSTLSSGNKYGVSLKVPHVVSQGARGYIETFFLKHVLSKNEILHISENFHLLFKYTPWMLYPYVSSTCLF